MMPCKLSDLSPSSILLISTKDNSLKLWRKKDQKLRLTNSIMVSHLLPINPPPDKCLKSNLLQMRLLLKNRKSQEICWVQALTQRQERLSWISCCLLDTTQRNRQLKLIQVLSLSKITKNQEIILRN
jgi:hypothetical protein